MQAGYLGGVWSAVKAGVGAGTVALLVGLQPVLTALWITRDRLARARRVGASPARQWLGPCARLRRPGSRRLAQARQRRGHRRRPGARGRRAARASPSARSTRSATSRRATCARPAPCRCSPAFVVCVPLACSSPRPMDWHVNLVAAMAWSVVVADARRQLAALPADPARRSDRGDEPALSRAAVHRADGMGSVRRSRSRRSMMLGHGAHGCRRRDRRSQPARGPPRAPPRSCRHETRPTASPSFPATASAPKSMPEGLRVLDAAASRFDIDLAFDHFDFASWNYYEKHGAMMPDDWKDADRRPRRDLLRRGRLAGEDRRTTSRSGARCSSSAASSTCTSTCGRRA